MESGVLWKLEHKVHVLDSLSHGSFQQIVDNGGHKHAPLANVNVHQALVCIHHLLEVDGLVAHMGERRMGIILLIGLHNALVNHRMPNDAGTEDATGKVATLWYEVDVGKDIVLNRCERTPYLLKMLVAEGLIDADVVVAPRKVGRSRWFLSCTSAARDGYGADWLSEQAAERSWK